MIMDYALFAHEKLALLGLSCNAFPETYNPRPHCDCISYHAWRSKLRTWVGDLQCNKQPQQ